MKRTIFLSLILSLSIVLNAEIPTGGTKSGNISGKVIDGSNGAPVEYATVALFKTGDEKLITGGITDADGYFVLKNNAVGNYHIKITFMGYKTEVVNNIAVTETTKEVDLGSIILKSNSKELESVDVVAEQTSVQYKIDKKVINVSQQLTARSGTAVTILESVPGVKVDIEGNVSLRGSSNFTVLIDGRPTVLDASDALAQIPAGSIENIEIITNPSAKYEPEGTSGIINIITKKNSMNGTSGIINLNLGSYGRYGADATVDIRQKQWHYYVGADYNNNTMPGDMEYNRWNRLYTGANGEADTILYQNSNGEMNHLRESWGLKLGGDVSLTKQDEIGLGVRFGSFSMERSSTKNYEEYTAPIYDYKYYSTEDVSGRGGLFYSANLNYKHTFTDSKEHYLESQIQFESRNMDEETENYSYNAIGELFEGKYSTESGPNSNLRIKLDYVRPFALTGGKIEAGGQFHVSPSTDFTETSSYDSVLNAFVKDDKYTNSVDYIDNIYAVYGMVNGERGNFGYQAGLRMEYTYRFMELAKTGEQFVIDQPDYFPTLHFSYKLPADQESMLSYTRRIVRPHGWELEPFISYMDANNVRQGNPEIIPEYVNSFDLGYQKKFGQNFVSLEAYYRITENKSERIMRPWEEDKSIILHTFENVGTDYSLGAELMVNYSPAKWYTANFMMDAYKYDLKVDWHTLQYTQSNFSWSGRLNNTFRLSENTRFQLDFNYNSESVRAQGTSAASYMVNAALKQDFLKRQLSAVLQVRDVFGTGKWESVNKGYNFNQYTLMSPASPVVTLTLTYKLNNYKQKMSERGENGGGEGFDGGF